MVDRVDSLTPAQEAQLEGWRQKWLAIGLSTEPADRAAAENGVRLAYEFAGEKPPKKIIWCDSPLAGARKAAELLGGSPSTQVSYACYGQHDAGWLGFYDFLWNVCQLDAAEKIQGLCEVAKHAGWWWAMDKAVILTERPTVVSRDEQGRLHSLEGPAIAYPDKWALYAVHGIRVARQIIEEPETMTIKQIRSESNVEVRRVMIERFGMDRFVKDSDAETLHTDTDGLGHPRRLLRLPRPSDTDIVVVEVVNSSPEPDGTRKKYMLRVPPQIRTCQQAIAWTFGIEKAAEYAPLFES